MSLFLECVIIIILICFAHLAIYLYLRKSHKKSIINQHVVVTGGSSGIGLWVAIYAARLGAHVTIIARNVDNLGEFVVECCSV